MIMNRTNAFAIARDIRRQLAQFGAQPVRLYPSFEKGETVIMAWRDQRDDAGEPYYQYSTHVYLHNTQTVVSGVYDLDKEEAAASYYERIGFDELHANLGRV